MPIYEYKCLKCNYDFEHFNFSLKSIKKSDPLLCPRCSGKCEKKFPTGTTFILKGQGWYKTDYGHKRE